MTETPNSIPDLASAAQQLWAEANRLNEGIPAVLDEIQALGLDVIQHMKGASASSKEIRTRAVFTALLEKQAVLASQAINLSNGTSTIASRFTDAKFAEAVGKMRSGLHDVDPEKLANEELLALCKRLCKTVFDAPDIWAFYIASAHIPVYALVYFHCAVLRAYLGRPGAVHRTLGVVTRLVKAAANDLAGELIPFLGVLETVVDLSTPQLEREIERLRQTTDDLDRIFQLDDRLSELLRQAHFAKIAIQMSDEATTNAGQTFQRNFRLLNEIFESARRV